MAVNVGSLNVEVGADVARMRKDLGKMSHNINKFAKDSSKSFAKTWQGMAVGMASVLAITNQVGRAFTRVARAGNELVDLAKTQEDAEKALAAAIESVGRQAELSTEYFEKFASAIQAQTRFGDEAVLSAQSLLIQLTNLDKEGLQKAMKGAAGLATVYKQDLYAATTLVGKALAGNYGALSRYGIVVEQTLSDEEKRISILQQLSVMWERAKADVDTFAGAQKQLANIYGDLKEKLGDFIIKNKTIIGIIKQLTAKFKDWGERLEAWRKGNQALIDQEIDKYFNKTVTALESLWKSLGKAKETTSAAIDAFAPLLQLIGIALQTIKEAFKGWDLILTPWIDAIINAYKKVKEFIEREGIVLPTPWKARMKMPEMPEPEIFAKVEDEIRMIKERIKMERELKAELGLINYELEMLQLQSEAAWEAYQKGIQPATDNTVALWKALQASDIALQQLQMDVEKGIEISTKGALKTTITGIEKLNSWLNKFARFGEVWVEKIDKSGQKFYEKVAAASLEMEMGMLTASLGWIGAMLRMIDMAEDFIAMIKRIFQGASNLVSKIIPAFLKDLPQMVKQFFAALGKVFSHIIPAFLKMLPELIKKFFEGVTAFIEGFITGIPLIIEAFIEMLPMLFTNIWQGWWKMWQDILRCIWDTVKWIIEKKVAEWWEAMKDGIAGWWDDMRSAEGLKGWWAWFTGDSSMIGKWWDWFIGDNSMIGKWWDWFTGDNSMIGKWWDWFIGDNSVLAEWWDWFAGGIGEWWEELAKFPFTIEELEFFNKIDYDPEMLDIDCCKLKWKYDKECEESFLVHAKNCPYIKAQKKLQKLIDSLKTGD